MIPAALAIIETVVAVVQLFSAHGESLANLLHIQTEMLRVISQQIVALQKGIETIISQLEEVQKLLGELPAKIVQELYQRRLNSLDGTYVELMTSYSNLVKEKGIKDAQDLFGKPFEEELLKPLREVRSVLFTSPENVAHFNIPFLSTALQIEVHGMVMANYPSARIRPALDRYKAWFEDRLSTLPKQLWEHRSLKEIAANKLRQLFESDYCCQSRTRSILGADTYSAVLRVIMRVGDRHYEIQPVEELSKGPGLELLMQKGYRCIANRSDNHVRYSKRYGSWEAMRSS